MIWFSKDEKKPKEEIERIKKTIAQGAHEEDTKERDFREHTENISPSPSPSNYHPQEFVPPSPPRAPLFVKLEKYDMIIKRIQMLDEIIRNTIEVMKINDELERVRNEVVKTLLRNLQESIKIINFLNRELVRPVPMQPEISYPSFEARKPEIESLEEHVSELKRQLEELKKYF